MWPSPCRCAAKVSLALGRLGLGRKIATGSIKQPDQWLSTGRTSLHAVRASVSDRQVLHSGWGSDHNFPEEPMPTGTCSQTSAQLGVQNTPAVVVISLWPLVWLDKTLPTVYTFVCPLASMALDEIGPGSQAIRSKPYREGGLESLSPGLWLGRTFRPHSTIQARSTPCAAYLNKNKACRGCEQLFARSRPWVW